MGVITLKKILIILSLIFIIAACSNNDELNEENANAENNVENQDNVNNELENESENVPDEEESENDEVVKEDDTLEINNETAFAEFTFTTESAEFFAEDDKDFVEIDFSWINQAGDGKKQLMNLAILSVKQNDEELTDLDDSWDIMNNNKSPIYFPNAENGEYKFSLTYEIDKDKPVEILIMDLAGGEKEVITINE